MKNLEILRELEERLLNQSVRRNRSEVASLLADDFLELGSSGRQFSKSEVLDRLQQEPPTVFTLDDFETQRISETAALVTYRVKKEVAGEAPIESLRSSLWIFRKSRWRMLFHQGTTVPG